MAKDKKNVTTDEAAPKKKKQKKVKTREQKLVRKRTNIIICLCVFGVVFMFFGICGITTKVGSDALLKACAAVDEVKYTAEVNPNPILPVLGEDGKAKKDDNGNFNFIDKTGELDKRNFKVLQITDVHIGAGAFSIRTDKYTINTVEDLIRKAQPDLVVVTGDIAYPVFFQSATLDNQKEARAFATLMENLGVYWTFAFGNHDTELYSSFTREQIGKFYAETPEFKHCIYSNHATLNGKEVSGTGNFAINIKDKNEELVHSIFMVDSNSYLDDDPLGMKWHYDGIHKDQISWYQNMTKTLGLVDNDGNISTVASSSMWFHIPIKEFRTAFDEWQANGNSDTANVIMRNGYNGEWARGALGTDIDNGIYNVLCDNGTTGVFCGHDHYNNGQMLYKKDGRELNLTYGMSIDYLAYPGIYKKTAQRGGRIVEINAKNNLKAVDKWDVAKDYNQDNFTDDNTKYGFATYRLPYWIDRNNDNAAVTLPEGK